MYRRAWARVSRNGKVLGALAFLLLVTQALTVMTVAFSPDSSSATTATTPTCLDGSKSGPIVAPNSSVAIIKPIFTSTPYSQYAYGSFYAFYKTYVGAKGNITTHLDWLNTSVKSGMGYSSGWGHTYPLYSFLKSPAARNCGLVIGKNVQFVSDINVSDGALFSPGGKRNFDAAVIGHQEYVTKAEYDQLREFVASGGILVAISSNEFYALVRYNHATQMETFVIGHGGYTFNGKTAWYSKSGHTPWNTSGWFGSTYCCFYRFRYHGATVNGSSPIGSLIRQYIGSTLAPSYTMHEENAVSNFTKTSIIATFYQGNGTTVASYAHQYGRGVVICFCVFGEDLIDGDKSTEFFLVASIAAGHSALTPSVQPKEAWGPSSSLAMAVMIACALFAVPSSILLWRSRPNKRART